MMPTPSSSGSLSSDEAPFLLVGAERSGSTLLRLMLDSHPQIAFVEEFEYATELVGDDGAFPDPATFGNHLQTSRVFATSGFRHDPELSYQDLLNGFLRELKEAKGATIVGATVHFGFSRALHIWPDANFIHLIRDPRDVAPSVINMGWEANMWWALNKWVEAEDEWDRLLRGDGANQGLAPNRHLTIRYDDLVSDHEQVLKALCQFMVVDYSDRMLDYTQQTDYALPNPAMATGWRKKLSPSEIRLAEARVGPERLAAKGFTPSGYRPLTVGPRRLLFLKWHNRVGRLQMRVRNHGLRFTVADLAARAVGNQKWQRKLRLEAMEVEKSQLKKSWSRSDQPLFSATPPSDKPQ